MSNRNRIGRGKIPVGAVSEVQNNKGSFRRSERKCECDKIEVQLGTVSTA